MKYEGLVPLPPGEVMSPEEVEEEVRSWSAETLADFVLECAEADYEFAMRVRRRAVLQRAPMEAMVRLRDEIRRVLDVKFVDWRHVDAYTDKLSRVIGEVRGLGKTSPATGLIVARFFIDEIPAVFDRVEDEYELSLVCEELVDLALALWKATKRPLAETGAFLLDTWQGDDYLRFSSIPQKLAGIKRPRKADREWLLGELARRRKATEDRYQERTLSEALGELRKVAKKRGRRK